MDFKITTDAKKTIKSIKGDGFSLLGYEEKDFLNQEVENFFSKESGVPVLFSNAEEAQLKERGYLKSLPKNFLSKDKHIIPIDLGVENNSMESGPKTDLVFTIHRERQNNKNEVLLRLQNNALEKLAAGKPLKEIFDTLTNGAEGEVNCAKASILVLDNTGTRLLHGSTPSFSDEVRNAFNGMIIGPLEGSCGSAVYSKELVVAEDISTDPRWKKFADFALANGFHASSSSPIMGTDDNVLGSFALTFTQSKTPTDFELEIIKTSARIAALAIEKNRSEENLQLYAQKLKQNNEELKNFTFVASHDLKEPLRKINLFVDQLLEKNLDQQKRDNFIE
ncbi:MAG: GAF domain-containing protein, partial [Nitrospina sp.]|nr:GAF domain-containing protein [Nitrospina sp.]